MLAATGTEDLVQMDRRNIQKNIPSVKCKQIDEATLNHIKERFIHYYNKTNVNIVAKYLTKFQWRNGRQLIITEFLKSVNELTLWNINVIFSFYYNVGGTIY